MISTSYTTISLQISEPEKPFDPLSLTAAKRVLASRSGAKHDPSPAEDSFLLLENQCRSVKKSATRKSRIRITGINSLQLEQVNDNVTTAVRNILDSVKKEREELKAEIDNRFDFIETNLVNLLHALDTFGGSNGEVVIPN